MNRNPVLLLAALLVGGCAITSSYEPPASPPAPERFASDATAPEQTAANVVLQSGWWKSYNDPVLDQLVEAAVTGSPRLKIAAARVREARTLLFGASTDRYPTLSAQASAGRTRRPPTQFSSAVNNSFSTGLYLSYEPDFWGRIESTIAAAALDAEGLASDAERAYHSLVTQVVQAYVNARLAAEQSALALTTVGNDRQRLDSIRVRYEGGLTPAMDVYQTEQTLAGTEARARTFEIQATTARHALNVLSGRYPAAPLPDSGVALQLPTPVPAGLPSQLLGRRPDLRSAETKFAASHERLNSARGDLLPKFSLTAAVGRESTELRDLFIGDHTFWNLLGNLTYPLLNRGKLDSAVDRATIQKDRAFLEYGETVLQAFQEVEDALVTERELRARRALLTRSTDLATLSLEAAESRYFRGLDNLTPSLNARRAHYAAATERIENRRALLVNRAALHLALGGNFGHEPQIRAASEADMKESSR